jgi:hypothetical protein
MKTLYPHFEDCHCIWATKASYHVPFVSASLQIGPVDEENDAEVDPNLMDEQNIFDKSELEAAENAFRSQSVHEENGNYNK